VNGGLPILGKGQLLGTFSNAAELSAAFGPGRRICFAPSVAVEEAVAVLVKVIHERVDMDIWVWAYGDGPDDLATLSQARDVLPGLDAAFEHADESEAIALMAILAQGGAAVRERMLSHRARELSGPLLAHGAAIKLALRAGPRDVERRARAFRAHGGPGQRFWTCDRTLGVRFVVDHDGAWFRTHHSVIQQEMISRCEQEGIDLA